MEGWIKLHRKLLEWEWYRDNNVKIVFLHLLLTANHTEQKWQGKTIFRGQKITSIEHLAEETNLTVMQVRTALKKLKATKEITIETTSKNTLVTIEKYNDYQVTSNENNKEDNKQSNNEITNEQQTNNKQITTNKNDKNIYLFLFNKYKGEISGQNFGTKIKKISELKSTSEYNLLSKEEQNQLYIELMSSK